MVTAYRPRPMSQILAPAADTADTAQTGEQKQAPAAGEAAPAGNDLANEVPAKFRGKSTTEVIEMYKNLESETGRLRNDVGTYRGLVNDLSQLQRQSVASKTPVEEELNVTSEDILADPIGAVRKITAADNAARDAESTEALQANQLHQATADLYRDFADMESIAASPEFQEFGQRTPSRQRDMQVAANGEGLAQIAAARRLMEDFADFTAQQPKPAPTPVERARAAATEQGGHTPSHVPGDLLHESDVLELIRTDPQKYRSPSFQKELNLAIKEKRYVPNS